MLRVDARLPRIIIRPAAATRNQGQQRQAYPTPHRSYYNPAVPTWNFAAVQVLGLAALGVVIGAWLRRRVPLVERLNIPAPILGGMVYATATLALRGRVGQYRS
jgi:hypothetical protein